MVRRLAALALAFALGCGGNTEVRGIGATTGGAPGDAGEDTSVVDAADEDGAAAGTGGTQAVDAALQDADEKFPWICTDGGAKDPYKSCCGGHVCLGTCEEGICHCGGIGGGCVLPSVCCAVGKEQLVCGGYGVCLPWK